MTRQQRMMQMAIDDVSSLVNQSDDLKNKYGSLCHNFPVMVRQCGLCQAVAFLAAKNEEAHKLILKHAQKQLGVNPVIESPAFASQVAEWSTHKYVLNTRLLLQAFAFYKRFAESILEVDSSDAGTDSTPETEETEETNG